MGKKMEKIKEFGKKHWKEILGAVIVTGAVGGMGYCVFNKANKHSIGTSILKLPDPEKVEKMRLDRIKGIDWKLGELEDITRAENFVETWVNKVPVTEMGKLGEELINNVDGVTADSTAWALISIEESVANG